MGAKVEDINFKGLLILCKMALIFPILLFGVILVKIMLYLVYDYSLYAIAILIGSIIGLCLSMFIMGMIDSIKGDLK